MIGSILRHRKEVFSSGFRSLCQGTIDGTGMRAFGPAAGPDEGFPH